MKAKLAILTVLFAFILIAPPLSPTVYAQDNFVIDGDTVYIDDSKAYISATPHTITDSGEVEIIVKPKTYTGEIDVVLGVNTTILKPKYALYYNPHDVDEEKSYTVPEDCWYEYTTNPKYLWVYTNITHYDNNQTGTTHNETVLVFEHSFETADLPARTIYWTEVRHIDWINVADKFTPLNYEHGGMNKWFYHKGMNVVAGNEYKLRVWIDLAPSLQGESGKYWFAVKPSTESIQEAIQNGHLYALDPWYNSDWSYKRTLTITGSSGGAQTNYQMNLTVHYGSGTDNTTTGDIYLDSNCNSTFDDLRFVNATDGTTVFDYWNRTYYIGDNMTIFVEVPEIPNGTGTTTVDLYYGNNAVSTAANGTNTFVFFDDFAGASIDTNVWEGDTGDASVSGSIATITHATLDRSINTISNYTSPLVFLSDRKWTDGVASSGSAVYGLATSDYADRCYGYVDITGNSDVYLRKSGGGIASIDSNWVQDAYHLMKIIWDKDTPEVSWFEDTTEKTGSPYTTAANIPTNDLAVIFNYNDQGTIWVKWVALSKYVNPEPTWTTFGAEEAGNAAPTNDDCGVDNPQVGTKGCLSKKEITLNVTVTDSDGTADLENSTVYVDTATYNYTLRFDFTSATFSEVSDANNYFALGTSTNSTSGNTAYLYFKFTPEWNWTQDQTLLNVKAITYDGSTSDNDDFTGELYIATGASVQTPSYNYNDDGQYAYTILLSYENATSTAIASEDLKLLYPNGTLLTTDATNSSGYVDYVFTQSNLTSGGWKVYPDLSNKAQNQTLGFHKITLAPTTSDGSTSLSTGNINYSIQHGATAVVTNTETMAYWYPNNTNYNATSVLWRDLNVTPTNQQITLNSSDYTWAVPVNVYNGTSIEGVTILSAVDQANCSSVSADDTANKFSFYATATGTETNKLYVGSLNPSAVDINGSRRTSGWTLSSGILTYDIPFGSTMLVEWYFQAGTGAGLGPGGGGGGAVTVPEEEEIIPEVIPAVTPSPALNFGIIAIIAIVGIALVAKELEGRGKTSTKWRNRSKKKTKVKWKAGKPKKVKWKTHKTWE